MSTSLSVVLITKNAASHLAQCLKSCTFANEIIIVDSGSEDNTAAIAQSYGAKFISQNWLGFGPQKKFAVSQAKYDWVLCIDADEWVTESLSKEIITVLLNPKASAYFLVRCNKFMGKFLKHGEGYPDLCLRLFDRRVAHWSNDVVHEIVKTNRKIARLKGLLMHESAENITTYLKKQNLYTTLQAQNLFIEGKNVSITKIILSPLMRFIKFYFIRLGLLDGLPGFVHILIACMFSFIKYIKLLELYRLQNK